ncbi:MAG: site-specific DNA-methyltransferase [Alphaproteobacteria bacterium]|nr:site-specific DNA-methyltransferase [Alphaproteobacteria bacterium]
MSVLEIAQWPLDRLLPYARNARTHSDDQVAQIAASIAEFGFNNAVLVDEQGEIIAGHGRLLAARQLGLAEVPVVVLAHLNDAQKRAFRIGDNQIALNSAWDEGILRQELDELRDLGVDLSLTGFELDDIDRMLAAEDGGDANEGGDEAPEPPADPVSRPGDLWLLGEHRLLCGDATILDDVEKSLGGTRAAMCFSDPPYNVGYTGGAGSKRSRIANDDLGKGFATFLFDACVNILACTDGAVYLAMSSSELHSLQNVFVNAGGHWSTFIIWAKDTFTLGRADYQRQYEPILYGWREGVAHHWCGDRDQGDVWQIARPRVNDLHPTMKPVELVERAVRNSSRRGDLVLDPFGGSGTTLIACEKAGRKAALVELDPAYCDVIVQRWQEMTGKAATLDGDGRTFAKIVGTERPQGAS